ncbi:MAG: endo-1,4-beta-xylanase [Ignavibacteriaceae bacterium]
MERNMSLNNDNELNFKPYFVQRYSGPNLLDWAYASDDNGDAFYSNITSSNEGIKISGTENHKKFAINVRWFVEDFGYIFITLDNAGEFYELSSKEKSKTLNLNFELAKSRVARNRKRIELHKITGWNPSVELEAFVNLSQELFNDAEKLIHDGVKCAEISQKSLLYAMKSSEMIELEKARFDISKNQQRKNFFIGCDARAFMQMDSDLFMQEFSELFNYSTITHYLLSSYFGDFEREEGKLNFEIRDLVFKELKKKNITVEGRPMFWFYKTVTPDWLRNMSFDNLLKYVEKHTREVLSHYGDGMYAWEVMNEAHDWANELQLKPEQIVAVAKLACEVAKDTNPKVKRLINNCCPFAEYVQLKKWGDIDAKYPQRTPQQFMKSLVDAGVDFDITGQQMYFPFRDLSDIIIELERMSNFGKPVHLTEVGASSGPNKYSVETGSLEIKNEAFAWHRPWDENLQADWIEGVYTLAFSKPWVEAINWYDFVDPFGWIKNGGLLSSPNGEKKEAFLRIKKLKDKWKI